MCKYPPPRWIFVDVDGTLSLHVIDYIRQLRADGWRFVLWSSRGELYARTAAEQFEAVDLFEAIVSKPGFIMDDKGWSWVKYTRVITRLRDPGDKKNFFP